MFIAERRELSRWRATFSTWCKQVSKFDGKNADDFLEWSSKLRVSLSLYSKPIVEIVQGSQRPSGLDNDQVIAREGWDDANHNLFGILFFTISGPAFSAVRRFEWKTRDGGVGHGQDAWGALREKFDGCSREALQAAYRELETVKMRSDEDPDDFLYKKDRCRDRLNSVTPKEGPLDRRYKDIILQCLPPEYDRIRQTHFEREDCNLADIRRIMSKIYAENLARSQSDSSRGIAGRGIAMQATGRDLVRPPPTATPNAALGQQTGPTATPTSPKSVLRVFLGSAVRESSLCEMNPTRSPSPHSWQERSSLRLSAPKPK